MDSLPENDTRVLNWGLLSTARINKAVIPPLKASIRNRLAGVASRSLGRAKEFARKWSIKKTYGSYEEMLADPEIDVVYNPLPNHLHAEWTIKAADAGKHVLCEKPLALTVKEVDNIIAAARRNNVVVAEAFMYQHHPQTRVIRDLITSGQLGEIQLMQGTFSFVLSDPADIRWPLEMGGGSIWDIGCYPISYSLMIAGEAPVEVVGTQITADAGSDLTFTGQLRFPGGAISQVSSSFGLPYYTHFEIRGSEAALVIPLPFKPDENQRPGEFPILIKEGQPPKEIQAPVASLYPGEVEDIASAVLDGKPQLLPLEQSRIHIATINALLESARTGKAVRL